MQWPKRMKMRSAGVLPFDRLFIQIFALAITRRNELDLALVPGI
jgi:hypothetical protein